MRKWEIATQIIVVVTLSAFIYMYLNKDFPFVGRDYMYFIPRLIDTLLHYKVNGLSIQWYTPSFDGGIPAYPNPQNIQFSLPQLFTMVMDPWSASIISTIVFVLVGYFAMDYFLIHVLSLRWQTGVLGGLFFSVNGFVIEHVAAGHLGFQSFPLLPLIGIGLFASFLPEVVAAAIIALVFAILVYGSGFYSIVIIFLSYIIVLPILYLYDPHLFVFKRFGRILLYAGLLTLLVTGSKLYAIVSLLRIFPRQVADHYHGTLFSGLKGIAFQLLGTMNLVPLRFILGKNVNSIDTYLKILTGAPWDLWELDVSLSPVLFVFLGLGVIYQGFILARKKTVLKVTQWIMLGALILATWITLEFTMAKGFVYPLLKVLPILNSLRANVRFASAFIFPLSMVGAVFYEKMSFRWKVFYSPLLHSVLVILTLAGQFTYFAYSKDMEDRAFSVITSIATFRLVQAGNTFPIKTIADVNDDKTFIDQASDLWSNEPLFQAHYGDRLAVKVIPGPITEVRGGRFNLTDPTGYVFPEVNGTAEFDRFPVADASKLYQFTHRYQPDWRRPVLQDVLDVTSLVFFLVLISIFVGFSVYRYIKQRRLSS
jgi:hypothetical protein